MNTLEKLRLLRDKMKEEGLDGYLIPSSDPHMTEYLPDHYRARSWFSGFDGSSGTLAVTMFRAALWTDGRYFVQAKRQLKGSNIELMRTGEKDVLNVEAWLAEELPHKGIMGICSEITSSAFVESMDQLFREKKIRRKDVDLITPVWGKERPALPQSEAWILEKTDAGKSPSEKIREVRENLKKEHADSLILSRLDSVAWLLNIRAKDVVNTPFALAFCLVLPESVVLFTQTERVGESVRNYLLEQGVKILPYNSVLNFIGDIEKEISLLYEPSGTSEALLFTMRQNPRITIKQGNNCIDSLKCIKNQTEIKRTKQAHVRDGIAMVRFSWELRDRMAAGVQITESDVAEMVLKHRRAQDLFLEESFETIAAYGSNAAMMHYHPDEHNSEVLKQEGFLLVDSGGQYRDGTTDITRTYALGKPTEEELHKYTMVLKAHIRLANVVFREKTAGCNLDILAREVFWKEGLDYRCGTGHGVGFVGIIHEGPQAFNGSNQTPIVPGMILTDEPGLYEEGKLGIRIENELLCTELMETEYGRFYSFEPITYCPIDMLAVVVLELGNEEREWLNNYHRLVEETLSPYLNDEERKRLRKECKPILLT